MSANRLGALDGAGAIVTLSTYMRDEYVRHGLATLARDVRALRPGAGPGSGDTFRTSFQRAALLLSIGRLERIKGIHLLLDALPHVREALGQPLSLTIIGDGPERADLERRAAASAEAAAWR